MDVLIDRALVRGLLRAELHRLRLVDRRSSPSRNARGPARSPDRTSRAPRHPRTRTKCWRCPSATYRPSRAVIAYSRAIHDDAPGTADVDDAELATREERIRARFTHRLESQRAAYRRRAADDQPLDMAVDAGEYRPARTGRRAGSDCAGPRCRGRRSCRDAWLAALLRACVSPSRQVRACRPASAGDRRDRPRRSAASSSEPVFGDEAREERAVDAARDVVPRRNRQEGARVVVEADGVVEAGGFGGLLAEAPHPFRAVVEPPGRAELAAPDNGRRAARARGCRCSRRA